MCYSLFPAQLFINEGTVFLNCYQISFIHQLLNWTKVSWMKLPWSNLSCVKLYYMILWMHFHDLDINSDEKDWTLASTDASELLKRTGRSYKLSEHLHTNGEMLTHYHTHKFIFWHYLLTIFCTNKAGKVRLTKTL